MRINMTKRAKPPVEAIPEMNTQPEKISFELTPEETQNLLVLIEVAARHFASTQPMDKAASAFNVAVGLSAHIRARAADKLPKTDG